MFVYLNIHTILRIKWISSQKLHFSVGTTYKILEFEPRDTVMNMFSKAGKKHVGKRTGESGIGLARFRNYYKHK